MSSLVDNFACSRTSEGRVGENLHLHLSDHAVLMGEFLAAFRDLIGDVIEGLDEELWIGEVALVHDDSGREGPGVDGVGDALPNEVQLGLGRAALIVRGRFYQSF